MRQAAFLEEVQKDIDRYRGQAEEEATAALKETLDPNDIFQAEMIRQRRKKLRDRLKALNR